MSTEFTPEQKLITGYNYVFVSIAIDVAHQYAAQERAKVEAELATMAKALRGLRDYFQFMIEDPKFPEFVAANEAIFAFDKKHPTPKPADNPSNGDSSHRKTRL